MKMSRILLLTALLIAVPLATVAEEAARTRPQCPYAAIDLAKMFTAGPLSDPQPPSTLLPAGATSVELKIRGHTDHLPLQRREKPPLGADDSLRYAAVFFITQNTGSRT